MQIEIDDEELEALIAFQKKMWADAFSDDCKYRDANRRMNRITELFGLRRKSAA